MSYYIFRMPQDTPKLNYDGLVTELERSQHVFNVDNTFGLCIGTTVRVIFRMSPSRDIRWWEFRLYDRHLADIGQNYVTFTKHGDKHQATRAWLEKIVQDNGIGHGVFRCQYQYQGVRYSPLCIDGNRDRKLEGYTFQVNHGE